MLRAERNLGAFCVRSLSNEFEAEKIPVDLVRAGACRHRRVHWCANGIGGRVQHHRQHSRMQSRRRLCASVHDQWTRLWTPSLYARSFGLVDACHAACRRARIRWLAGCSDTASWRVATANRCGSSSTNPAVRALRWNATSRPTPRLRRAGRARCVRCGFGAKLNVESLPRILISSAFGENCHRLRRSRSTWMCGLRGNAAGVCRRADLFNLRDQFGNVNRLCQRSMPLDTETGLYLRFRD